MHVVGLSLLQASWVAILFLAYRHLSTLCGLVELQAQVHLLSSDLRPFNHD